VASLSRIYDEQKFLQTLAFNSTFDLQVLRLAIKSFRHKSARCSLISWLLCSMIFMDIYEAWMEVLSDVDVVWVWFYFGEA
jgi:hypothetical protein